MVEYTYIPHKIRKNQNGQAALLSIIILTLVALTIAIVISVLVLNNFRGTNSIIKSQHAFHVAEAALDDIKVQLKKNDTNWAVFDGGSYSQTWTDYLDSTSITATLTSVGYIQTISIQATYKSVKRFLYATCDFSTGLCTTTEIEPS